jgi:hypothetical protein
MKSLKYLIAIVALTGALTLSAKADLQFIEQVDFNNGPNSPSDNLALLNSLGFANGFTLCTDTDGGGVDTTIAVEPGEILIVHFGVGPGGTGSGGGFSIYEVINGETSVTVPGTGEGPFGLGGSSSIRGFCPPGVPDGGMTVALLGIAFVGLEGLRRMLHARKL